MLSVRAVGGMSTEKMRGAPGSPRTKGSSMPFTSLAQLQFFPRARACSHKHNPVGEGDQDFVPPPSTFIGWITLNKDINTIRTRAISPSFPHPENACLIWPPFYRHPMQNIQVVQSQEYGWRGK